MHTRNHMDVTTPVKPEVPRVANYQHKKELIYPYIFDILTKVEIKIVVSIDEASRDLPPTALLHRPVCQYV